MSRGNKVIARSKRPTPLGGHKLVKGPTKKESLAKLVEVLQKDVADTKRSIAQMAYQMSNELGTQHERTQASWQLVWAVIEVLKSNGIDVSDEELSAARESVLARWKLAELANLKQQLKANQAICEKCFHQAVSDVFAEAGACPKCESDEVFFSEVEAEVVQEKAS